MESVDDFKLNEIQMAILRTSLRRSNDSNYGPTLLDKVMYVARMEAKERSPPVIVPKYRHQMRLGTVF
ncbi:hypothetical protein COV17_02620 [Candidatus Woesearchaeota archaeon CG10_big_fil_rev_8_21_14_0_10_36_11]|nr:MAG: hypothetical protein COV17_02620 [Candidatus Woesearchaeota archaeon CG10_big_fil_rev_8_21_14_0_10_36_11]